MSIHASVGEQETKLYIILLTVPVSQKLEGSNLRLNHQEGKMLEGNGGARL